MPRNFDIGVEGFEITETDEESSSPQYFLFLDRYGNWLIKRLTTVSKSLSVRYIRGSNQESYIDAWTNRASLSYDYFDRIF